MKFMDDILYLAGWICVIVSCWGVDWRMGLFLTGAACMVTAVLFAKWGGGRK